MSEKRPFFEDQSFTTPSPQQKIPRVEAATDEIPQPDTTEPDIPLPSLAPQPPVQQYSQLPLFRSIVGDEQTDAELNNLLNICNGDLLMAINAYYSKKDASTSTNTTTTTTTATTTAPTPGLLYFGDAIIKGIYLVMVSNEGMYIEYACLGWSTMSGKCPVKEGDSVILERSKHVEESGSRFGRYGKRRENTIVRFSSESGREIGRIDTSEARYISKLLDLGICAFRASIVICPYHLSTANDIFLHVQCYFTTKAFDNEPMMTGSPDHDDERSYKDRTLALLSIMRKTNLKATKSTVRRINMKTGVDDDETYDMITQSIANGSFMTATQHKDDDDDPDAFEEKEVSNEQLDMIYGKAQFYDDQISPMENPETMAIELKPYQKRVRSDPEQVCRMYLTGCVLYVGIGLDGGH